MLVLSNSFRVFVNNFNYYYQTLTNDSRLVLYIVIILLFITIILILIMFDQKKLNIKVIKTVNEPNPNKDSEQPINSDMEIDDENEKTRNLKEISDKIKEVIDNRNIELTSFEHEQEENSIISYEELLKKSKQNKPQTDMANLVRQINSNDDIIVDNKPLIEPLKSGKFKNSEFISPIFGFDNKERLFTNKINKPIKKEEEIEILAFNDDIKATGYNLSINKPQTNVIEEEKFLMNLKEFRNNLD